MISENDDHLLRANTFGLNIFVDGTFSATSQIREQKSSFQKRLIFKATSQSTIFCACVREIKDSDDVLPVKDSRHYRSPQL